jgi:hypothetical protein
MPSRQMRGSRVAGGDGGAADRRAGGSRSQMAATTEDAISPPAIASIAASSETAAASGGSENEAAAAPTWTAVWRSPSASPRSRRGNQPNTARPLPPVAAAENIPATNIAASSAA